MESTGPSSAAAACPPGRHWWSPKSARDDRVRISAGRAYVETLAVFGAFFAASIAVAGFTVGGAHYSTSVGGWQNAIPASIDQVAVTALAVAVPLLLAARRGLNRVDLGLAARPTLSLTQGIRMAAWAVLALVAGSAVTTTLASGHVHIGFETYPDLTVNFFHAAQAGFLEETVALAFVVTTLEQARRPVGEILVVAVLLRASYHIYYGPGVAGVLIWASVFVWLYLRFRSIVPLVVVHSTWDVLITLTARWHFVGAVEVLLMLALFVTAPVTWMVGRSKSKTRIALPRAPLPPPGWYPDPAGPGQLRWWTGTSWWWATQPGPLPPPAPAAHPADAGT
jgi:hypothetical protein